LFKLSSALLLICFCSYQQRKIYY